MDMDSDTRIHLSLENILHHKRQIDAILQFWFGQFNPDQSQKQLWMINASSQEHLQQVDKTITLDFFHILTHIITNTNNQREFWCCEVEWFSWHGKLASIILLDQMSRHIHRHVKQCPSSYNTDFQLPDQSKLDQLAYSIAQRFQHDHQQEIASGMIPLPMVIFSLMPYRHASTLVDVGYVLQKIEDLASLHHEDMENMIRRFRRASNRRMAGLQDEARRKGWVTHYESVVQNHAIKDDIVQEDGSHDDEIDKGFKDEDILETIPFDADFSTAGDHIVVKTMIQYLKDQGLQPQPPSVELEQGVIPIVISLSGGVDSMVIASSLVYLRDHGPYSHLYIVAVHIDYGNRPESEAEANYVHKYSMETLKLEECTVKKVEEFKRGVTDRDEYEKATRNIRYDLYKATIRSCRNHPRCTCKDVGVMLGHHQGDVRENVLSNAHKGCGPLDLSGMTSVSMNDGVLIYRPLLTLEKSSILDYAHKYGIPYFKDTTPHWSTRGKLRNKLLPLLEEIYGDGCMMNLTNLARESDEARQLINDKVLKTFMEKVSHYPMGIIFHTRPFKEQGLYFWKLALRDVLHSAKRGMFGDKTIISFLKRVLAEKIRSGWLQCRNDYAVYLNEDGRVCVFHPDSFPPKEDDNPLKMFVGKVVPCGEEGTTVGPWQISCEIDKMPGVGKLEQKAVPSWDKFMEGHIEYYLEVPLNKFGGATPQLSFVDQFTKSSRPKAWKGTDMRIEHTIPILGIDLSNGSVDGMEFVGESTVIVKVTLDLRTETNAGTLSKCEFSSQNE